MFETILATSVVLYLSPFVFSTLVSAYKKGWSAALTWPNGMRRSALTNIAMGVTHMMIAPGVFLLNAAFRDAYNALGIPHVPIEFWGALPLAAVLIVALIAQDFADYWNHRLLHTRGFWSIHAVHHSDPDMNHTTSVRIHVVESFIMACSYTLMLSWIGIPPEGSAGLSLLFSLYNRFVHIDADIHFGPLVKIFATPRFHQWHHAVDEKAHNTNFANIFSFWDVLFGTYRVPGPCKVPLGFEGSPNHNYLKLMAWPFLEAWNFTRTFSRPSKLKSTLNEDIDVAA